MKVRERLSAQSLAKKMPSVPSAHVVSISLKRGKVIKLFYFLSNDNAMTCLDDVKHVHDRQCNVINSKSVTIQYIHKSQLLIVLGRLWLSVIVR